MRPLALGGRDDAAIAATLPLALALRRDPFDDSEPVEAQVKLGNDRSLLAMKNPFIRQQEFICIVESVEDDEAFEGAVTFASPAPVHSAPQPSDLALRAFDALKMPRNPLLRRSRRAPVRSNATCAPRSPRYSQ